VALLALIITGTNLSYLRQAVISGTDMPGAVMLLICILFLCRYSHSNELKYLIAAGGAIGIGYLVRYTALTVVPAVLLWLWIRNKKITSWKHRLQRCLIFLGGFILLASPQLVSSFVVQGNPLYNLQARNVYFGMFGSENWGLNMPAAGSISSLSEVILAHPREFLSNWFSNLLRVPGLNLVQFPLIAVSFAGLVFSFMRPQSRDRSVLLSFVLMAFTAAICMAFPNARLLLFSTIILCIFAAFGLFTIIPRRLPLSSFSALPIRIPCLIAFIAWLSWLGS